MSTSDMISEPNFGLSWLDASGPHSDIVLSTRVRIARNLQGYPFTVQAKASDRAAILLSVREVLDRNDALEDGVVVEIESLEPRLREVLLERHLVSRELVGGDGDEVPHSCSATWPFPASSLTPAHGPLAAPSAGW